MKARQKFAPVIILVLNRYKHFKACLESLEKCTWSNFTDVYIALDYPPTEEYRSGWLKICEYLQDKEKSNLFNKLIVIKRDYNYGVKFPDGNFSTILLELQNRYDRYIVSEDDNVFSPNFLVYLNKGLEKYEDDDRISLICGYNYPMEFPSNYRNNFYISKQLSSWGYGTWFSKEEPIKKYYDLDYLKGVLRDEESYEKLRKQRPSTVHSIVRMIKNGKVYGDSAIGCYLCLENKFCVFPTISKVKNYGTDGTGVNAKSKSQILMNYYINQTIDIDHEFEFSNDIFTYEPSDLIRDTVPAPMLKKYYKMMIGRIDLFFFRYFNYVPKSKYF